MKKILGAILITLAVTSQAFAWQTVGNRGNFHRGWMNGPDNYQAQIKRGFGHLPQGLTFYKDFSNSQTGDMASLNADYSIGSPVATYTANRSATNPATYVDGNGVVRLMTTGNVPRIKGGYYDSTGFHAQKGLMIEGAGTNRFTYSDSLDNANWTKSNAAITSTLVSDSSSPYLGTVSNVVITDTGTFRFIYQSPVEVATTVYTVSCFVKSNTGGNQLFRLFGDSTTQASSDLTATTSWKRFTYSYTSGNNGARWTGIGSASGLTTLNVLVVGMQTEASPYATSFIPTTTASLTRNAEVLKYPILNNRTAAQESLFVKFSPIGTFANDNVYRHILSNEGAGQRREILKINNETVIKSSANSVTGYAQGTTTPQNNTSYTVSSIIYGSNADVNVRLYLNSASEGTNSTNYTPNTWGTNFTLGCDGDGTTGKNLILQSFVAFNRPLSAGEVSAVTSILQQN